MKRIFFAAVPRFETTCDYFCSVKEQMPWEFFWATYRTLAWRSHVDGDALTKKERLRPRSKTENRSPVC